MKSIMRNANFRRSGYTEYFPTVVLQKGNRVISAMFYQTGTSSMPYEDWVRIVAQSIG